MKFWQKTDLKNITRIFQVSGTQF